MKYTHSSLLYVFKNIWYIGLLSLLPAFCLSSVADVEYTKEFFVNFFAGNLNQMEWLHIFHTFSIYCFTGVIPLVLDAFSFLSVVVCASMLLALIDKHMRIGKRTLNGLWNKVNDNITSTFFAALFFSLIYEIWALVFSSLTYAIFALIPILSVQYVLFAILLIGGGLALLYVVSLFYLWLPCMQITGFEMFEALRYSNQMTERVKIRIMASMALSLVIGSTFVILSAVFFPAPVLYAVMFVVFMFYFMLFLVRMEVIYFDAAQLEREDLKKHYAEF